MSILHRNFLLELLEPARFYSMDKQSSLIPVIYWVAYLYMAYISPNIKLLYNVMKRQLYSPKSVNNSAQEQDN